MRFFAILYPFCSFGLVMRQVGAHTTSGSELIGLIHENIPTTATRLETALMKSTSLTLKNPINAPINAAMNSSSPFSQMLVPSIVNTRAICVSKGGTLDEFGRKWDHELSWAACDPTGGDPRRLKLVCASWVTMGFPDIQHWRDVDKTFYYHCPDRTVCQPVRVSPGNGPPDELACVDEPEVTVQPVNANNREDGDLHCSLTLALPGSQYRARPGVKFVDLILTEQVLFPSGKYYKAPKLFIRDTTNIVPVNRALRLDSSIASAQVRLTSVGGKLQTKTFEFCMQRLPGMAGASFTFVHSWFQIASNLRHGRIHTLGEAYGTLSVT